MLRIFLPPCSFSLYIYDLRNSFKKTMGCVYVINNISCLLKRYFRDSITPVNLFRHNSMTHYICQPFLISHIFLFYTILTQIFDYFSTSKKPFIFITFVQSFYIKWIVKEKSLHFFQSKGFYIFKIQLL